VAVKGPLPTPLQGYGRLPVKPQEHQSPVAVHGDELAVADPLAGLPSPQYRRDAELAGDDRTVGQHPAYVGHQPPRLGE